MGLHTYLQPDLANLTVRPLCLAALASLGLWRCRNASASASHAVWTVVLAGMLLQGLLGPVLPPIPVTILRPLATVNPSAEQRPPVPVTRASVAVSAPYGGEASLERPRMPVALSWKQALSGIYAAGAIVGLTELLLGYLLTRRLVRAAAPSSDLPFCPIAELFESRAVSVPVTVGCIRPKILLPPAWREWDGPKLRAVLAHEEAHVRRADWTVAVLAQLNCCLFWFHPLAWWLKRRLATLAEQACDDCALALVSDREQYANVFYWR